MIMQLSEGCSHNSEALKRVQETLPISALPKDVSPSPRGWQPFGGLQGARAASTRQKSVKSQARWAVVQSCQVPQSLRSALLWHASCWLGPVTCRWRWRHQQLDLWILKVLKVDDWEFFRPCSGPQRRALQHRMRRWPRARPPSGWPLHFLAFRSAIYATFPARPEDGSWVETCIGIGASGAGAERERRPWIVAEDPDICKTSSSWHGCHGGPGSPEPQQHREPCDPCDRCVMCVQALLEPRQQLQDQPRAHFEL